MNLKDFKQYFQYLLEFKRFQQLLQIPYQNNQKAVDYIESRLLKTDICDYFYYNGSFKYQNKEYKLNDVIVVPLIDFNNRLHGVWIRFIDEKCFYIWLISNSKYWISKNFDVNKPAFICESIFDAVSLSKLMGSDNVCAALGVQPSPELLEPLSPENVILAFDNDLAGKKSALKCLNLNPRYSIINFNHKGKDFNDILISGYQGEFKILPSIQAKIAIRSTI